MLSTTPSCIAERRMRSPVQDVDQQSLLMLHRRGHCSFANAPLLSAFTCSNAASSRPRGYATSRTSPQDSAVEPGALFRADRGGGRRRSLSKRSHLRLAQRRPKLSASPSERPRRRHSLCCGRADLRTVSDIAASLQTNCPSILRHEIARSDLSGTRVGSAPPERLHWF